MSQDVLNVELRKTTGKRRNKRLRLAGKIPAILYGHGEGTISLTLDALELKTAIRHNAHLVKLEGETSEDALLKNIQWDAYGSSVLHVDLTRVDADETVEVELEILLRGTAPGTKQGGVVEHPLHRVRIECPAISIPENLELNINSLELDQSMTLADLELPEGAKLLMPLETPVVNCVEPAEELEDEAALADGAEPEVIGAKKDEDGED